MNGIKSIQGDYEDDQPVGIWIWRDDSGQVTHRENMDLREKEDSEESVVEQEPAETKTNSDEDPSEASILNQPKGDYDALEEIQPYGEGSFDALPEKKDEANSTNGTDGSESETEDSKATNQATLEEVEGVEIEPTAPDGSKP